MGIRRFLLRYRDRQYVRPWALAAPVIVLMVALPLLRPLRHPTEISAQEAYRLAQVQSLVEQGTLSVSAANLPPQSRPAMPAFSVMLAGPYWALHRLGYRLGTDTALVTYLLTLLGTTMPAAAAPGFVYRMGRMFEIRRPWRFALSLAVAFCSGLVTYSTVLNPHAPAAFCALAAVACLVHVAIAPQPARTGAAIAMCGFFAALAGVLDLNALPFLVLLPVAVAAFRWKKSLRVGAVLMYLLGAAPPVALHLVTTTEVLSARPAVASGARPEAAAPWVPPAPPAKTAPADVLKAVVPPMDDYDEWVNQESAFLMVGRGLGRALEVLFGSHGLLSHFPVFVFAFAGLVAVLHRHWPGAIKALALVTLACAVAAIGAAAIRGTSPGAMYATRQFVCFSPALLFWAGYWLRERHGPVAWGVAITLVVFSAAVALIGATDPYPPGGYDGYTPAVVVQNMIRTTPAVAGVP